MAWRFPACSLTCSTVPGAARTSATPVLDGVGHVVGAVYATRSTVPVLFELHRIRSGLFKVLAVALALSATITVLLAFSISRPISRLSRAAKRIAGGERSVPVPVEGAGEIRELSRSFKTMTEELDARLAYFSEFSADVAHEFKSPLTSMRGAAELLAEGAAEDPVVRERFLRNILLDAERLDRLVSRLLVLGRIEASAAEMTLVDLRTLLERIAARAADRGTVDLVYESRRSWVRGREADLETALVNLLENAQRHATSATPVRMIVRDERPYLVPWIRDFLQYSAAPDGARPPSFDGDLDGSDPSTCHPRRAVDQGSTALVVSIENQGPSIPEARRAKIFERFYTTEADRGGTGLGLAIVESVVRAHGGRVTLAQAPEGVTRFDVWLPSTDR